jgi:hypothetical protein
VNIEAAQIGAKLTRSGKIFPSSCYVIFVHKPQPQNRDGHTFASIVHSGNLQRMVFVGLMERVPAIFWSKKTPLRPLCSLWQKRPVAAVTPLQR